MLLFPVRRREKLLRSKGAFQSRESDNVTRQNHKKLKRIQKAVVLSNNCGFNLCITQKNIHCQIWSNGHILVLSMCNKIRQDILYRNANNLILHSFVQDILQGLTYVSMAILVVPRKTTLGVQQKRVSYHDDSLPGRPDKKHTPSSFCFLFFFPGSMKEGKRKKRERELIFLSPQKLVSSEKSEGINIVKPLFCCLRNF